MNHVAVDTDIFFYSVGTDKKDRKSQLATGLLDHIDNHPALELCVPFSSDSFRPQIELLKSAGIW